MPYKRFLTNQKLPKKFKENWVNALTSGEYQQTTHTLCDEYGFCAIGVACRAAGVPEEQLMGKTNVNSDMVENYNLPLDIQDPENELLDTIIELNDNENLTFNQIASFIDENVEEV